jgi:acyl-CoA synthetase (AMP-forming)/AMP-acid ligase II
VIGTEDFPAGDRAASKVFRSELNPVDFLLRAAFVYPDKTAVVNSGVDAEHEPLVAPLPVPEVEVIRDARGGGDDRYAQFLAAAAAEVPESWLEDEEETISINYTSGATGRPKGVQYTYRGAFLNALGEVIVAGMTPESVYLWTLPMFHCNGWCFPWAVTAVTARHVALRAVDPKLVWQNLGGVRRGWNSSARARSWTSGRTTSPETIS